MIVLIFERTYRVRLSTSYCIKMEVHRNNCEIQVLLVEGNTRDSVDYTETHKTSIMLYTVLDHLLIQVKSL